MHKAKKTTQLFTSTEVQDNPKHWKPFGCPNFVLTSALRAPQLIYHKWKYIAELGIYLGPSPVYHRNVALILNPATGLISPQFHVSFDPDITTAPYLKRKSSPYIRIQHLFLTLPPPSPIGKRIKYKHSTSTLSIPASSQ